MKTLVVMMCMFANDYSIDLDCTMYVQKTTSCALSLAKIKELSPGHFVKSEQCVRIKQKIRGTVA